MCTLVIPELNADISVTSASPRRGRRNALIGPPSEPVVFAHDNRYKYLNWFRRRSASPPLSTSCVS
ncbi:MAG: hypothetical protein R2696_15440 [Microthrixaceae bacterium]